MDAATALWILVPLAAVHLALARRRGGIAFQVAVDVLLLALPLRPLAAGAHLGSGLDWAAPWGAPRAVAGSPEQADLPLQFAVWWEEVRRLAAQGESPWVSTRLGGGTALLAHGQTGLPFPPHLPVWALGAARGTDVMAVWKLELAALGCFLLGGRVGLRPAAAATGALAYAFGLHHLSWLVVPLAWVIAGAPWALFLLLGALRGRRRDAAALALLLGALAGWSVHPESAAFLIVALAFAGTVLGWGRRRRLVRAAMPVLLAVPVAGIGALPTLVAIADSAKLAAARSEPSYPMAGLDVGTRGRAAALVLVPWREGHPADGSWRWPFAAAAVSVSIGAAPLALLVAVLPRRRHRRLAAALAVAGGCAAVLLYQAPGATELLARLPVLGWMVWARAGFLLPLALALGAALAADAWLRRPRPRRLAAAALAIQAFVAVLAATAPVPGARAEVWRSAWLPAALAAAVPLAASAGGWALPALVAAGSLAQGGHVLPASSLPAAPSPALAAALRLVDAEPGRVLGLGAALPPNLGAAAGLEDLRSNEPMRPRALARLHRALGSAGDGLPGPVTRPWAGLAGAWGVRWLVTPAAGVPAGRVAAAWEDAERVAGWRFYRNSRCLPVTRLASRAVAPPGDAGDGAWEAIDFSNTAVVPSPPRLGGRGSLLVVSARPSEVVARVSADGPVLAVHHAPLAPGWEATVDGRPAPLLSANLAAMAVAVEAGEHEVRFTYAPPGLAAGAALTLAGLAGCGALALARRRRWH